MPHKLPEDVKNALNKNTKIFSLWEDVTMLAKNEWICWIISAKKDETRIGRINKMLDDLEKGKRRPCCWGGCTHRK